MTAVAPDPPVVAVLGGGQLGRMLGLAGVPLGVRCRFLDPGAGAPAAALGPLVVGPLGDEAALAQVAAGATVATYEWEGVPAAGARFLEARLPVRPGPAALDVAQDRLAEKDLFRRLGIGVADYVAVDDRRGLSAGLEAVGVPSILKTRRGGYDGKGQVVLRDRHDATLDAAWGELGAADGLILEAMVPFDRELSVLAVRGLDGETACYPLVENVHREGILRVSRAPAPRVDHALAKQAAALAGKLLDEFGYVGVLAVELFDVAGMLFANEIAPRVHNSGHWTIEGAETSQFENHLRAVLGWPLGSTAARDHSVMVNCIGEMPDREAVLAIPGAHLHDYGKEPRPNRKVGHVTITAPSSEELASRLDMLRPVIPSALG
ncbi:MAG TPA: 5-(carboxyamino)imidazole ribonucleotide synthase [Acidimicrobiia bacterium]|nr:5-(carboxyamino)imidazole ribonucleotide synthase [Acidimicrobiia bacterium]